jgi:hypothetical protein
MESKLKFLLSDETNQHDAANDSSEISGSSYPLDETMIDISLRTPILSQSPPSILLLINTPEEAATVTVNIEIGPNGQINVSNISGPCGNYDHGNTNGSFTEHPRAESQELRDTLAKVLETCEDLGLLIEWVLRWFRRQKNRPA